MDINYNEALSKLADYKNKIIELEYFIKGEKLNFFVSEEYAKEMYGFETEMAWDGIYHWGKMCLMKEVEINEEGITHIQILNNWAKENATKGNTVNLVKPNPNKLVKEKIRWHELWEKIHSFKDVSVGEFDLLCSRFGIKQTFCTKKKEENKLTISDYLNIIKTGPKANKEIKSRQCRRNENLKLYDMKKARQILNEWIRFDPFGHNVRFSNEQKLVAEKAMEEYAAQFSTPTGPEAVHGNEVEKEVCDFYCANYHYSKTDKCNTQCYNCSCVAK